MEKGQAGGWRRQGGVVVVDRRAVVVKRVVVGSQGEWRREERLCGCAAVQMCGWKGKPHLLATELSGRGRLGQ